MSNKVKVILAVVLLVIAAGAIAYYLTTSRGGVDPMLQSEPGGVPAAPADVDSNG